jgi:hypothetical protein
VHGYLARFLEACKNASRSLNFMKTLIKKTPPHEHLNLCGQGKTLLQKSSKIKRILTIKKVRQVK